MVLHHHHVMGYCTMDMNQTRGRFLARFERLSRKAERSLVQEATPSRSLLPELAAIWQKRAVGDNAAQPAGHWPHWFTSGRSTIVQWLKQHTFASASALPFHTLHRHSVLRFRQLGYAVGLIAALLDALLMLLVMHLLPNFAFPNAFTFFIIAIVALTWGAGPSMLTTVASGILSELLLTTIVRHRALTWNAAFELVIFLAVGLATSVIASQKERARRMAEELRQTLEQEKAHAQDYILQQSNRRLDDFMGIASHELRTPLAVMKGSIQVAARRLSVLAHDADQPVITLEPAQIQNLVQILTRADLQVLRINQLVSDLTDVSRIEAGRLEIACQPVDLPQLVREAAEAHRLLMPDRSIVVLSHIPSGTLIALDAERIKQVIFNFLSNALKFSESDRPVLIEVTGTDQQVRVTVTDQGIGMSKQEQAHIWDRYHQAAKLRVVSGTGYGLGLGLYICRTIIEQHGGDYGVASVKDRGSAFWFTLPC